MSVRARIDVESYVIEAEVNPANLASCALLRRVGFTLEGTLRQRWVAKGQAYDTHLFGWLATDR